MVTTLYIVRHGQSEGNQRKFFQGTMDLDLSPLGQTHIAKAGEFFKNIPLDCIYSSDLMRAYKTSKAILEANLYPKKQQDVFRLKELNEIFAGDIQGLEYDKMALQYPELHEALYHHPSTFAPPHGESMQELYQRVSQCVQNLLQENEGKTILLTSHGCSIKTMLCYICGLDLIDMPKAPWIQHGNAVKAVFEDGKLIEMTEIDIQRVVSQNPIF